MDLSLFNFAISYVVKKEKIRINEMTLEIAEY